MCACHAETGKHGNEAIGQKCNYAILLHILAFTGIFVVNNNFTKSSLVNNNYKENIHHIY
jgi:hypothetical protein